MLFESLHCKGLLVHMYFLDEKKCVLIFKTDNNKMLYLKIMCFHLMTMQDSDWVFSHTALPRDISRVHKQQSSL